MPRRNVPPSRRRGRTPGGPPEPSGVAAGRTELWDGQEWLVRPVPGARSVKTYRCPGCDQEIRPGTGHVVVWPADERGSVQERRHWHTGCWSARERRGPTGGRR